MRARDLFSVSRRCGRNLFLTPGRVFLTSVRGLFAWLVSVHGHVHVAVDETSSYFDPTEHGQANATDMRNNTF